MLEIYSPEEDSYLLSEVLKKLKIKPDAKVLEIGCGSGIQLQILKDKKIKKLLGVDINPEAVAHCRKIGFNCFKSDLFENIDGKFNIIIFNPPYLPEDFREPADSSTATTGGKKGSEIINRFLEQAKKHLFLEGKVILLTSSLTGEINWRDYNRKILARKKLFFEELLVWELSL
ncbi:MAG: HemK2/MTQ2 family protein methyltransferase [archaeon]